MKQKVWITLTAYLAYCIDKVYTNVDPVLRHATDQIPAGDRL